MRVLFFNVYNINVKYILYIIIHYYNRYNTIVLFFRLGVPTSQIRTLENTYYRQSPDRNSQPSVFVAFANKKCHGIDGISLPSRRRHRTE